MEEVPSAPQASRPENSQESQEGRAFRVEHIRELLTRIDGIDRPNLIVIYRKENIKGELMSICFTSGEKEIIEGEEHDITYLLNVAGQRYMPDGSPGRIAEETVFSKDCDGVFHSEKLAIYADGEWQPAKGRPPLT